MSEDSKLLCKNCKHSFVPLPARLASFPFMPDAVFYKCRLSKKEKHIQFNPITGPQREETSYDSCSIVRSNWNEMCGVEGKSWVPKSKKHLFLAITRGES
jgi:hypothetical protein